MEGADEAREQILDGVEAFSTDAIVGELVVFGDNSTAVMTGLRQWQPATFLAAARHGDGRVVAFGHDLFVAPFREEVPEPCRRIFENALRWASGGEETPSVLVFGVEGLADWLTERGCDAVESSEPYRTAAEQAGERRVVVFWGGKVSEEDAEALRAFVASGGGLLCAGLGWAYETYAPRENGVLPPMPQNTLLAPLGLAWSLQNAVAPHRGQTFDPAENAPDGLNASDAAGSLARWFRGEEDPPDQEAAGRCSARVFAAQRTLTGLGIPFGEQVREAARDVFAARQEELMPGKEHPIETERWFDRLLIFWVSEYWRLLPPDEVPACPTAADFPGDVPDGVDEAEVVVPVETSVERWVGTGVYARPGRPITVVTSAEGAARRLRVRIGSHADELYSDREGNAGCQNDSRDGAEDAGWIRWPDVSFDWPLVDGETRVASPFGGLVYIVVPDGEPGEHEVTVRGGVLAPTFVLDRDSEDDWRSTLRHLPAPWAELRSPRMELTVPSSYIRELSDPEAVLRLWEQAMTHFEEIVGRPFTRAERIVIDRQIAAGYMHSGYPIMGLYADDDEGQIKNMIHSGTFRDGAGIWGHLHEIGHNLQRYEWTFEGAWEVTNNILVLYVLEHLSGTPAWDLPMMKENRPDALAYFKDGPSFDRWKEEPFVALHLFAQIQRAFGWEPFKQFFAGFRDTPEDQLPQEDDDKRDQWLIRLSHLVGHNLGPFFEHWRVPTSSKARAEVARLPAWKYPPVA